MAEPQGAEDCELTFAEGLLLSDAGEVALEDYARVLTVACGAEAVRDDTSGNRIVSLRLVGPRTIPSVDQRRDIEDFARGLAADAGGLRLGWS